MKEKLGKAGEPVGLCEDRVWEYVGVCGYFIRVVQVGGGGGLWVQSRGKPPVGDNGLGEWEKRVKEESGWAE